MRNLWRLLAFDIVAPLAAIGALVMIGVVLVWLSSRRLRKVAL